jgi:hypothetical protein
MIMAMQDKLGARRFDCVPEEIGVDQALAWLRGSRDRRVMDENDAKQTFPAEFFQPVSERRHLARA